ncbi:MAG: DUF1972 domain-containing protein [Gammaproteobacteria bacterium]|nr:DUF1972 domain-containing protein [Gammaproteobacteria bacterium]
MEEISVQLVAEHDIEVVVYCRSQYYPEGTPNYKGVRLVYIPVVRNKYLESVLHTVVSTIHSLFLRFDAVLLLDPANAPNLLILRLLGAPAALHTDGLGSKRKKWGRIARAYYKFSERLATWLANELVSDSIAMKDYYLRNYGADSTFLPYGCEAGVYAPPECLERFGLAPRSYYLVVTRIEPDNNTDLIIREYRNLETERPLVIVGGARYPSVFSRQIEAEADGSVRVLGGVYDAELLNSLYRNAFVYLHGHEVGGTNPSLLRAMSAGACCAALDTTFSREVLGESGCFFGFQAGSMAQLLRTLEETPVRVNEVGAALRKRARREYRWDAVTAGYAELFRAMIEKRKPGHVYRPEAYSSRTPPTAAVGV